MSKTLTSIWNGYSRMMLQEQIAKVREIHRERKARLAAIRTRGDAEKYREQVSEKIRKCFGRFPKRTPLNARITGVIEGPQFRIEKLLLESRPGFFVSANFYVPNKLGGPAPAILGCCGNDFNGKAAKESQAYSQEMAQCGFPVLTFDALGHGERCQFPSMVSGGFTVRDSALAGYSHNMMGKQTDLIGEFFGSWMAWDGMRALDYLLGREEVDPDRVSVTGNSVGGVQSTWLWTLDRRLKMAAPSCFVSTFLANAENELPGGAEQYPPGALEMGLEIADFFIARAPAPAIIISQRGDFFDWRGAGEVAEETARIYRLLGAQKNFAAYLGSLTHAYFPDGREAMRKFFCGHLKVHTPKKIKVEELPVEKTHAAPEGQVLRAGSKPLFSLVTEKARTLRALRPALSAEKLRQRIRKMLKLPKKFSRDPIRYRNLRGNWLQPDHLVGRYGIATEPGIEVILRKIFAPYPHLVQALQVEKAVRLYVPHWSCQADFQEQPLLRKQLGRLPLYGVDVRGIGESAPLEGRDVEFHEAMEYMAYGYDMLLGRPTLGLRVFDLLRTCDLLVQEGAKSIEIIARGQGALIAAFATALSPAIKSAQLHGAPTSFEDWTKVDLVAWHAPVCLKGVLQNFDLPDIYTKFKSRISVKSTWSAQQCPPPVE